MLQMKPMREDLNPTVPDYVYNIIPDDMVNQLRSRTYRDITISNRYGTTELFVTYTPTEPEGMSDEIDESALIFGFEKIDNKWILTTIQIVG